MRQAKHSNNDDSTRRAEAGAILVVDDSAVARAMMRHTLEEAGYRVLDLPSAVGATRIIQSANVRMVVVDIQMPGLSGDSLIEVLRMHPRFRDIGIVVVSGQPVEELEALRSRCGADAAVPKGELRERLVSTVSCLFSKRAATRLDASK
jgi:two-component system chemotaxis response regulator CheY